MQDAPSDACQIYVNLTSLVSVWTSPKQRSMCKKRAVEAAALIGGRWHMIPQLAVYTTYIPLIYCQWDDYIATYHLVREPETAIDHTFLCVAVGLHVSRPPTG